MSLNISVTQSIVMEDGKPYTDYILSVESTIGTWEVSRRFKMFCSLQMALKKEFPHIKLPESNAIFNLGNALSRTLMVLSERRKSIQGYLNKLAGI